MKYYLIAGEASGDLHGANLMKAIKTIDSKADFRIWGGDLMVAAGGKQVMHYKERAYMGFVEVIQNLNATLGNLKLCKKDIEAYHPDALIFIDYSGFNLRIAKWAKPKGFTTYYYISPQVWASRQGRVKTIKKTIHKMIVVLPFVKDFYEKRHRYPVEYVGHPLIDAIADRPNILSQDFIKEFHLHPSKPIIALLPGSRKQEIKYILPVMLSVTNHFEDYQFVIAGAPSQRSSFYKQFIQQKKIGFVQNRTQDLLSVATAALVASGTATLETALLKVPQVVCYRGNYISYQIAKRIIKLKYISLVNLIMNKPVVKELIQNELTTKNLKTDLSLILDKTQRKKIFDYYDELEKQLGGKGASKKAAEIIVKDLKERLN